MTSDRIVNRITSSGYLIAEAKPRPAITAGGLRESLREFARKFDTDRRIAGRFEGGALVLQHLASVAQSRPSHPAWLPRPTVPGLPIVQNDNLQLDEWRLLDTDGGVMGEGRINT